MTRVKRFFVNGMILTATSLIMSGIGVWYSVYISNRIGSEAMGVYQLIMSVYSFAVTLAASGISFAATRLVAEELGQGREGGVRKSMRRCVVYALCFSTAAGVLLFAVSEPIGRFVLKNPDTVFPMKTMAFGLPFLAVSASFGGYFTAVRRVVKNAGVQILEQVVRIGITLAALSLVHDGNLMHICLAIAVSGVLTEIMSFVSSLVLYLNDRKRYDVTKPSTNRLTKKMLSIAVPIALSSYLRSGLLTLKNLLVPLRLQKAGLTQSAAVTFFGMMHGVVLPILLFPSAFISSFSGLMIPELSEYRARDHRVVGNRSIYYLISRMLQLNLLFSIGVAGVIFTFAEPLAAAVGGDAQTTVYLRIMAPIIPVMYVDNCVDCVLKGLNEQLSSMKYNIIDAAVSVLLVLFLLPHTGTAGYVAVICFSEILNFALSLNRMVTVTNFRIHPVNAFVKPIAATVIAGEICRRLPLLEKNTMSLVLSIACQTAVYVLILMLVKCIRREDGAWLKKIFINSDHKFVESCGKKE